MKRTFSKFQLTAARRRLGHFSDMRIGQCSFQLTAARRRLVGEDSQGQTTVKVSTHSRPKAAGCDTARRGLNRRRFNSQPPEGGWFITQIHPRRNTVSTHSRPKAAGRRLMHPFKMLDVSTHSRPKAAGASAETLAQQGLHRPVSLRFHQKHMALL